MNFSTLAFRISLCAMAALFATGTQAADIAGAKEPAFLPRFKGSDIVNFISRPYDQYKVSMGDSFSKVLTVEGQIVRVVYHIPKGHAVFELVRNYEAALETSGFHRIYEHPFQTHDPDYIGGTYQQSFQTKAAGELFPWPALQEMGAIVEKGVIAGHDTTVVVTVGDYAAPRPFTFENQTQPVNFSQSELAVVVDVITSTQMQNSMVTVSALDMAAALASTGKIDLYGVYFDTDKTAVKPESKATLDEIGTLMKSDTSLKLELSGHTDNTGSKDHNMTLSQGRADAVVKALTTQYGIDPKRLVAKGYGDTRPVAPNTNEAGKAKNRRVELSKL
jgi:OOP family OmpA-OmpF porin